MARNIHCTIRVGHVLGNAGLGEFLCVFLNDMKTSEVWSDVSGCCKTYGSHIGIAVFIFMFMLCSCRISLFKSVNQCVI